MMHFSYYTSANRYFLEISSLKGQISSVLFKVFFTLHESWPSVTVVISACAVQRPFPLSHYTNIVIHRLLGFWPRRPMSPQSRPSAPWRRPSQSSSRPTLNHHLLKGKMTRDQELEQVQQILRIRKHDFSTRSEK